MTNHLAPLLLLEAILFVLTMSLAFNQRTLLWGEYVGTGFHLLLMPVMVGLPASLAGQAAGFLWVGCDVMTSTFTIWNSRSRPEDPGSLFLPVRMAGHLFAALWITSVSLRLNTSGVVLGIALALGFAGYTLAGGRLSEKVLAVPGLLLVAWLLLLAWQAHQVTP